MDNDKFNLFSESFFKMLEDLELQDDVLCISVLHKDGANLLFNDQLAPPEMKKHLNNLFELDPDELVDSLRQMLQEKESVDKELKQIEQEMLDAKHQEEALQNALQIIKEVEEKEKLIATNTTNTTTSEQ